MSKFCDTHDSYVKNRFYSYVNLPNENGCMIWTGAMRHKNYGAFSLHKSIQIKAHRYSYMLFYGNLPKELHVLHTCDNPSCVAPMHLYLGTNKENARDRIDRKRGSPPILMGEKNPKAKLNEEDVKKILNLIKSGNSNYSIAKKFNVTRGNILAIRTNKTWKHVPREVA